jgi:methyl-accepting chemotaxis protein
VQGITENVEQISYTVRGKVDELGVTVSQLNQTVSEINGRTRVQVSRVDGIVTDALTATQEISSSVQHSIKGPVKQVAGLVAGVKAGLETLIARSPFGREP